ncbi:tRNA uridine-5-carboxymethylaminomethyl(34) synthesis GTPase MnmE [Rhizobium sp. Leaf341]|uniref:tRNA uridine-5-carboxymethylaminomethyl(34) synthesis GTPase MnmE n=1 Tax=Rhizobium sp. Leaf341 TaxID=1736344 RepID=UPI0007143A8F|nr:tRNA uridine-5-carboxymethylaminomethyl(34) synthesis GTPase MnmE [Rhizobium sp. Leaf341]KQR79343.1 tRNA modification GTPase TrmE [Rhizobium sp. Leaf341]
MVAVSDTIYSLSSGGVPSGVAVIRISGPQAFGVCETLCGPIRAHRRAHLKMIRSRNGEVLDQGLVLTFPGPGSFTGEDCVELQIHGGKAVVSRVLDELGAMPLFRHAEAGEFSRRAFLNGKLDLVEVEGLADLLSAETEMQRRLASEHARGGVSQLYQGWAKRLTHARAMIEAELDFADEDDVPGSVSASIWEDMTLLRTQIADHLASAKTGAIIRDGYRVVISGSPNTGKSSLLNALANQDVAIVTDIAGTTRDILSVDILLAGFVVKLYDTAGLRETQDAVEREGIRRALNIQAEADLILCLSDRPDGFRLPDDTEKDYLKVATKIDVSAGLWDRADADVFISMKDEKGLAPLLDLIVQRLPVNTSAHMLSLPSRKRHADQLKQCLVALDEAIACTELDLQSEWLRTAGDALGRITGRVDVENLLDVIFSEFCIGK